MRTVVDDPAVVAGQSSLIAAAGDAVANAPTVIARTANTIGNDRGTLRLIVNKTMRPDATITPAAINSVAPPLPVTGN